MKLLVWVGGDGHQMVAWVTMVTAPLAVMSNGLSLCMNSAVLSAGSLFRNFDIYGFKT